MPASTRPGRSRMSISPGTGRPTPCAMPSTRICRWRARPSACSRRRSSPDDFDARFSAVGRHYLYRIVNRRAPLALEAKQGLVGGRSRSTPRRCTMPRRRWSAGTTSPPSARCSARRRARSRRSTGSTSDAIGEVDRDPRLGALLPAQSGPLDGRLAEARRRRRLDGRPILPRRWQRAIAPPADRSRRPTGSTS